MKQLLLLLLLLALAGARGASAEPAAVADFEAPMAGGGKVRLHDLLAKGPVLIDFWALWCKPCLKELPELDRLHRTYADRGFTVLAVNGDSPADVARVLPFVRSRDYAFPVVTDLDGRLRRRFQVNALPTAILLDSDGRIAWTNQGYRPGDEKTLEAKLRPLLPPDAPEGDAAPPDSAVAPSPRNGVN
jgi:cytochrome c biogenesis protein CcmG/thiol:disulfide interchange protein DsbE